ncbi:MAG: hypothetical protein AAGA56_09065 [Myxococcota bacterium]
MSPAPRLALEFLWCDPSRVDDLKRAESFAPLFAPPPKVPPPRDPDRHRPGPSSSPARRPDEPAPRTYLTALREGAVSPLETVPGLMLERLHEAQLESEPLLLEGRITFGFDPRQELETTIALTKSVAAGHRAVAGEIARAEALLAAPLEGAPHTARKMIRRLAAAWRESNRDLPDDYLWTTAERVLLTKRAYERVELLGGTWIRAQLEAGKRPAFVVYLPDAVGPRLPLFSAFDGRIIVDPLPRQDAVERSEVALVVIGLARRIDT